MKQTQRFADEVLEHIIKEGLVPLKFDVERADEISESGLITTQVIERIVSCDLLVADLSGHNANVFYEIAIRHLMRRPYIHLIEAGQKIPFDVAAARTITYSRDLSGAKRAMLELRRQAENAMMEGARVESPISVAVDLKALSSSEDPAATALRRIESEISEIKARLFDDTSGGERSGREPFMEAAKGFTDENVDKLKEMWNSGASASMIAREIGVPRNAVIGKVHRLGLRNPES